MPSMPDGRPQEPGLRALSISSDSFALCIRSRSKRLDPRLYERVAQTRPLALRAAASSLHIRVQTSNCITTNNLACPASGRATQRLTASISYYFTSYYYQVYMRTASAEGLQTMYKRKNRAYCSEGAMLRTTTGHHVQRRRYSC